MVQEDEQTVVMTVRGEGFSVAFALLPLHQVQWTNTTGCCGIAPILAVVLCVDRYCNAKVSGFVAATAVVVVVVVAAARKHHLCKPANYTTGHLRHCAAVRRRQQHTTLIGHQQ